MTSFKEKEPFKYTYNEPFSDWYREVNIEIKTEDYLYFRIERRFGPSWWIIGKKPVDKPNYHWKETQIGGEIGEHTLKRFIEWAKDGRGSRINEIKAISNDFDIIEEMFKLLK